MKLEQSYKFDVRDFESGKLIKVLKEIKQRYGITEEENNGLGNRKKVRHQDLSRRDVNTYDEGRTYGNWQSAKNYKPNRNYNNGWDR